MEETYRSKKKKKKEETLSRAIFEQRCAAVSGAVLQPQLRIEGYEISRPETMAHLLQQKHQQTDLTPCSRLVGMLISGRIGSH